ncbi:hypothetical protein BC829DRAFT_173030 [Chytridium lagenaria]|nr:hypothetical protein BC829DRAFT_173030 [Chytridium lagenaria]
MKMYASWQLGLLLTGMITVHAQPSESQAQSINDCPRLPPRSQPPTSVFDLRIDDIQTIMGIGTSAMAGFGARSTSFNIPTVILSNPLYEDRGVNFATGGDETSGSLGALIRNFRPSLKGLSLGRRMFEFCFGPVFCLSRGPLFPDNVPVQGLNAAQSGAWISNWDNQIAYFKDHLATVEPNLHRPDNFKLLVSRTRRERLMQIVFHQTRSRNPYT